MTGIAELFDGGTGPLQIPQGELQLIHLVGFMFVAMAYCGGLHGMERDKVLKLLLTESFGKHEASRALRFISDALGDDPASAYRKWFEDSSDFRELTRRFASPPVG